MSISFRAGDWVVSVVYCHCQCCIHCMNRVNSRNALSMMPESTIHIILVILLLADRTNGRAYATVSLPSVCRLCVCLCVCLSVCDVCIVAKWCVLPKNCLKKQIGNGLKNRMVTWLMTSRDPERSNSWPKYAWGPISRKQLQMLFSNNH